MLLNAAPDEATSSRQPIIVDLDKSKFQAYSSHKIIKKLEPHTP